jgi:hypothetical protein
MGRAREGGEGHERMYKFTILPGTAATNRDTIVIMTPINFPDSARLRVWPAKVVNSSPGGGGGGGGARNFFGRILASLHIITRKRYQNMRHALGGSCCAEKGGGDTVMMTLKRSAPGVVLVRLRFATGIQFCHQPWGGTQLARS